MKQQSKIETQIFHVEALSHEGRGIAHYGQEEQHPIEKEGKKVFIQFALPNETVKAKITHRTKRLEEADCIEIVGEPAKTRVQPMCEHFGVCGGCSLQHMQVDEQIRFKQDVLMSHLKHFAGVESEQVLPAIRSIETGYRRRARIGVRYLPKIKQFFFGFRERQSNRLINITQCPVLEPQLNEALPELRQLIQGLKGSVNIGHVELAMGDADISLLIKHTAGLSKQDKKSLLDFALVKKWQLYLQSATDKTLHRIDDRQAPMRLSYGLDQLKFDFSPLDFTQVNAGVNRKMVKLACELLNLEQGERVLDLFCGLGNFSLPMAVEVGETGRVVGIEGSQDMVDRGAENASKNGISQIQFFKHDLTQDFSTQKWAKENFDAILIDPPRTGAEEMMQDVAKFNAKRIVYVSCNPATLARDTGILVKNGYVLQKAGVMDMFTHTGHIESITLFERVVYPCNDNE